MLPKEFNCYLVAKDADGNVSGSVTERSLEELPDGDVLVRVAYSSLNYKDALAATGHPGVNRIFPHVPGADAAGVVAASDVDQLAVGDRVVVTGYEMGMNRWGGFGEYIRVPHDWIVPLPSALSLRESMIFGTAGFAAALCVDAIGKYEISPDAGEIVVTGASGGVGSVAVAILAKLGYHVAAVTGKTAAGEYLEKLGAEKILDREEVDDRTRRPMLPERWAAAVDTVGGAILATVLRATRQGGCVATCGMVAGFDLPITVYPFILRGVTLFGIAGAICPMPLRLRVWQRLAEKWKPENLETMATLVGLSDLPGRIDDILAGEITGRVVVAIGGEEVTGDQ